MHQYTNAVKKQFQVKNTIQMTSSGRLRSRIALPISQTMSNARKQMSQNFNVVI